MSPNTHVRLTACFLLTTISLLAPTHALPRTILINTPDPFDHASKDDECVLQLPLPPTNPQLVLASSWWIFISVATIIFIIFLIAIWPERVRRASRDQQSRYVPGRSHSVLAGEPILDSAPSQPPEELYGDAHHDRQTPSIRGKTRLAASASDEDPSRRNVVQDWAISRYSSVEEYVSDPEHDNHDPLAEVPAVVDSSPAHLEGIWARVISRWIQAPSNPPSNPTPARHPTSSVEAARSSTIPGPRNSSKVVQLQPRYQTLPQDAELPLPYPIETQTLQKSLLTGSKDFSAPSSKKLSVLVAAANDGLDDPEHDLGVLKGILQPHIADPSLIRFSSLAGDKATMVAIKGWFIWLYLLAILNRSNLLVLLSGRGNDNRMCLPGGAFLAESDICKWVSTMRDKFKLPRNRIPTIMLDICRESKIPSFDAGNLANMIRSCSQGELAHAIGFNPKNVSRSCFHLAFFLAAHDRPSSPVEFKRALTRWLGQVGKLRAQIHDCWHTSPGECGGCTIESMCDRPKLQTIEEGYAGWADLHQFGTFMATNHAGPMRAVVERVTQEMRDIEIWGQRNSAPSTSHDPQSTPIVV